MLRRKRQDKDVAYEGWNQSRESLQYFLPASPQQALSQFKDIEWSSSDEEDQKETNKTKSTPRLPISKLLYKRKREEKIPALKPELNVSSSPPVGRSLEDVTSTDNRNKLHEHSFSNKVYQKKNQIPDVGQRNLEKTPKKSMYGHELPNMSPVVGSQRNLSREVQSQAPEEDEISCSMYIKEPSSPILGSQTIVKRRRTKLGPQSYLSAQQGKDKILRSAVCFNSNVSQFEMSTSPKIGVACGQNNLRKSVCGEKPKSAQLAHTDRLGFKEILCKDKGLERDIAGQSSQKIIDNTKGYSEQAHNKKKTEQKISLKREQTLASTTGTQLFRLKKYENTEISKIKKMAVPTVHSNSQEICSITEENSDNFEIDIVSPFSPVQSHQEGSLESMESQNPSISEASSAATEVEETIVQVHKTGSEWLRNLQQITPVKQCLEDSREENPESAKKKLKKDGLASRLCLLIRSWQSSVQMWTHQMALGNPQGQPLQPSVNIVDMTRLPQNRNKNILGASPSLTNCLQKHFQSPVVRNLSVILASPSLTPTQNLPFSENHVQNSRKHLRLKIIRTGGKLPNNAAVCEEDEDQLSQKTMTVIKKECEFKKKEKNGKGKIFLVIFTLSGQKQKWKLQINGTVKVYAPWQHLVIPQYSVPILFTSYFTVEEDLHKENDLKARIDHHAVNFINMREDEKFSGDGKKSKRKTVLSSWSCTCLSGAGGMPSICNSFQCTSAHPVHRIMEHYSSEDNPGFSIIKESSEVSKAKEGDQITYSILKAIEKCGGVSDMPVTVTTRIHRIILHKNDEGIVDHWECIGQDASGMFCSIRIPNHPLVSQFKELLESGEGATFTLSHVTVLHRLTNTQSPGLFSVLSSLHTVYQSTIQACSNLCSLLKEHASRPPQTYCYVFAVNLRLSKAINNKQQVALPIKLPDWTLREAMHMSHDGRRCDIEVYILYKVENLLYVMSKEDITTAENDEGSKKEHEMNTMYNMACIPSLVISVLVERGTSLPPWIFKSGTVMQSGVLRYAVLWQGKIMIDPYSKIEQKKCDFKISLTALNKVLKPLSFSSQSWDLVTVIGTILRIDEESAYSWPACPYCLDSSIIDTEDSVECQTCGEKSSSPGTGYCLEVWLHCGTEMQKAEIKLKLYQRTIERLLSSCSSYKKNGKEDEGYDPEMLLGKHVGSLVCVLQEVRKAKLLKSHSFKLLQLPY